MSGRNRNYSYWEQTASSEGSCEGSSGSRLPGEAQADFGEALVVIAGVEQKAHFLAMDCRTRMTVLSRRFQAKRQRLSSKATCLPLSILAPFPRAFSTTTPRSRWRGYLAARNGRRRRLPGVAEPLSVRRQVRPPRQGQRQGRRGRTRRLCTAELHGSDSECQQLGRVEHYLAASAASGVSGGCADIRRPSANASSATGRRCYRCLLRPTKPAKRSPRGSVRSRWCVIAPTTTRFPPQFGHRQVLVKGYVHRVEIVCGSEVIARHQRSYEREAVVLRSAALPGAAGTEERGHWIRPRRWWAGSCRSASSHCGVCSKHG